MYARKGLSVSSSSMIASSLLSVFIVWLSRWMIIGSGSDSGSSGRVSKMSEAKTFSSRCLMLCSGLTF